MHREAAGLSSDRGTMTTLNAAQVSFNRRPVMHVLRAASCIKVKPHLINMGTGVSIMEEEYQDTPIVEQFESETSLMDKVNSNDYGSHPHEPREPHKAMLELQTVFGTMKQSESPNSCMLKSSKRF